ncbi:hypothetical protein H9W90_00365 [Polaribacter pectinis]|uniref:Lipoprotein n=1 Tax=Polaribacter pectinis TaxID=2738844 RepID=A0A7G9LAG3_9FLAO|nr:hypothetical protein [Polaribacter pectinis]QNM85612.1 hypothetical protein H9W90_00365 [Polaribacter pectinis]
MKKFILKTVLILAVCFSFSSCEDSEDPVETNITNRVMFWSDFQGPPISVTIEGGNGSGTITAINSSAPECGSSGNFTKILSPGTYSYSARDGNLVWNSSFTIRESTSCTTIGLTD